ncbi:hypothetical protein DID80_05620, partial [Candidatus Marinamargulisbacteria bacterium SCGC AAA071-K20]
MIVKEMGNKPTHELLDTLFSQFNKPAATSDDKLASTNLLTTQVIFEVIKGKDSATKEEKTSHLQEVLTWFDNRGGANVELLQKALAQLIDQTEVLSDLHGPELEKFLTTAADGTFTHLVDTGAGDRVKKENFTKELERLMCLTEIFGEAGQKLASSIFKTQIQDHLKGGTKEALLDFCTEIFNPDARHTTDEFRDSFETLLLTTIQEHTFGGVADQDQDQEQLEWISALDSGIQPASAGTARKPGVFNGEVLVKMIEDKSQKLINLRKTTQDQAEFGDRLKSLVTIIIKNIAAKFESGKLNEAGAARAFTDALSVPMFHFEDLALLDGHAFTSTIPDIDLSSIIKNVKASKKYDRDFLMLAGLRREGKGIDEVLSSKPLSTIDAAGDHDGDLAGLPPLKQTLYSLNEYITLKEQQILEEDVNQVDLSYHRAILQEAGLFIDSELGLDDPKNGPFEMINRLKDSVLQKGDSPQAAVVVSLMSKFKGKVVVAAYGDTGTFHKVTNSKTRKGEKAINKATDKLASFTISMGKEDNADVEGFKKRLTAFTKDIPHLLADSNYEDISRITFQLSQNATDLADIEGIEEIEASLASIKTELDNIQVAALSIERNLATESFKVDALLSGAVSADEGAVAAPIPAPKRTLTEEVTLQAKKQLSIGLKRTSLKASKRKSFEAIIDNLNQQFSTVLDPVSVFKEFTDHERLEDYGLEDQLAMVNQFGAQALDQLLEFGITGESFGTHKDTVEAVMTKLMEESPLMEMREGKLCAKSTADIGLMHAGIPAAPPAAEVRSIEVRLTAAGVPAAEARDIAANCLTELLTRQAVMEQVLESLFVKEPQLDASGAAVEDASGSPKFTGKIVFTKLTGDRLTEFTDALKLKLEAGPFAGIAGGVDAQLASVMSALLDIVHPDQLNELMAATQVQIDQIEGEITHLENRVGPGVGQIGGQIAGLVTSIGSINADGTPLSLENWMAALTTAREDGAPPLRREQLEQLISLAKQRTAFKSDIVRLKADLVEQKKTKGIVDQKQERVDAGTRLFSQISRLATTTVRQCSVMLTQQNDAFAGAKFDSRMRDIGRPLLNSPDFAEVAPHEDFTNPAKLVAILDELCGGLGACSRADQHEVMTDKSRTKLNERFNKLYSDGNPATMPLAVDADAAFMGKVNTYIRNIMAVSGGAPTAASVLQELETYLSRREEFQVTAKQELNIKTIPSHRKLLEGDPPGFVTLSSAMGRALTRGASSPILMVKTSSTETDLEVGDLILQIGSVKVENASLDKLKSAAVPKRGVVSLKVLRDGKKTTIKMRVNRGQVVDMNNGNLFGIKVSRSMADVDSRQVLRQVNALGDYMTQENKRFDKMTTPQKKKFYKNIGQASSDLSQMLANATGITMDLQTELILREIHAQLDGPEAYDFDKLGEADSGIAEFVTFHNGTLKLAHTLKDIFELGAKTGKAKGALQRSIEGSKNFKTKADEAIDDRKRAGERFPTLVESERLDIAQQVLNTAATRLTRFIKFKLIVKPGIDFIETVVKNLQDLNEVITAAEEQAKLIPVEITKQKARKADLEAKVTARTITEEEKTELNNIKALDSKLDAIRDKLRTAKAHSTDITRTLIESSDKNAPLLEFDKRLGVVYKKVTIVDGVEKTETLFLNEAMTEMSQAEKAGLTQYFKDMLGKFDLSLSDLNNIPVLKTATLITQLTSEIPTLISDQLKAKIHLQQTHLGVFTRGISDTNIQEVSRFFGSIEPKNIGSPEATLNVAQVHNFVNGLRGMARELNLDTFRATDELVATFKEKLRALSPAGINPEELSLSRFTGIHPPVATQTGQQKLFLDTIIAHIVERDSDDGGHTCTKEEAKGKMDALLVNEGEIDGLITYIGTKGLDEDLAEEITSLKAHKPFIGKKTNDTLSLALLNDTTFLQLLITNLSSVIEATIDQEQTKAELLFQLRQFQFAKTLQDHMSTTFGNIEDLPAFTNWASAAAGPLIGEELDDLLNQLLVSNPKDTVEVKTAHTKAFRGDLSVLIQSMRSKSLSELTRQRVEDTLATSYGIDRGVALDTKVENIMMAVDDLKELERSLALYAKENETLEKILKTKSTIERTITNTGETKTVREVMSELRQYKVGLAHGRFTAKGKETLYEGVIHTFELFEKALTLKLKANPTYLKGDLPYEQLLQDLYDEIKANTDDKFPTSVEREFPVGSGIFQLDVKGLFEQTEKFLPSRQYITTRQSVLLARTQRKTLETADRLKSEPISMAFLAAGKGVEIQDQPDIASWEIRNGEISTEADKDTVAGLNKYLKQLETQIEILGNITPKNSDRGVFDRHLDSVLSQYQKALQLKIEASQQELSKKGLPRSLSFENFKKDLARLKTSLRLIAINVPEIDNIDDPAGSEFSFEHGIKHLMDRYNSQVDTVSKQFSLAQKNVAYSLLIKYNQTKPARPESIGLNDLGKLNGPGLAFIASLTNNIQHQSQAGMAEGMIAQVVNDMCTDLSRAIETFISNPKNRGTKKSFSLLSEAQQQSIPIEARTMMHQMILARIGDANPPINLTFDISNPQLLFNLE